MRCIVVEIRRARASDAATLTALAHAAKAHWGYPEAWLAHWKGELTITPETIASLAVYCAVMDGRVVGFCALSSEGTTHELEHMWVLPAHMGRGIGARLFEHAVAMVRSAEGTCLRIASDPHADPFYLKQGARRLGEVASWPAGRTLPLLVFELD